MREARYLSIRRTGCAKPHRPAEIGTQICEGLGAGEGNRTLVCSLGSCRSTIELRPQYRAVTRVCSLLGCCSALQTASNSFNSLACQRTSMSAKSVQKSADIIRAVHSSSFGCVRERMYAEYTHLW